jgi:L-methionine (R)-S-oxide reductase
LKKEEKLTNLSARLEEKLAESDRSSEVLEEVARLLRRDVDHYDWVGFYSGDNEEEVLSLGPFSGEPTEHTNIDYGEGVCGQAADSLDTFTVQDVESEDNYLSCSPEVKSEIVVPVFDGDEFVGEIDIDSHELDAFGPEDQDFLEDLAQRLARFF